jgi:large subunit ribosomal protein L19
VNRIDEIEKKQLKKELPEFQIGDVVDVQVRIKEGEKERIQTFTGTVIARKGSSIRENFTVRRIVAGEGVERVFPLHAPSVVNVIVKRPGRSRRAKLYYLRGRVGKSTKTKERREDEVQDLAAGTERPAGAAKKAGAKKAEEVAT